MLDFRDQVLVLAFLLLSPKRLLMDCDSRHLQRTLKIWRMQVVWPDVVRISGRGALSPRLRYSCIFFTESYILIHEMNAACNITLQSPFAKVGA